MAIYGETGEIPLSIKRVRMMLNFYYRLTTLPEDNLAKKALQENVSLRTNWIMTIEKLLNLFNLTNFPGTLGRFKTKTKEHISKKFIQFWGDYKTNLRNSRMEFFDKIKDSFSLENSLNLPNFKHRKTMTKFRCSDHNLEVERGRHNKTPREERLCKMCDSGEIETEEHFLTRCNFFDNLKLKHGLRQYGNSQNFLSETDNNKLGEYLVEAFEKRKITYETTQQPAI